MNEQIAKELLKYIAENLEIESIFLYPKEDRNANIEVEGLLDKIAELRGITSEENGKQFNEISESIGK